MRGYDGPFMRTLDLKAVDVDVNTEVIYKVTAYYDPASERGLAWDDPDIGIAWPVSADRAVLTERDRTFPRLAGLPDFFPFGDYPN